MTWRVTCPTYASFRLLTVVHRGFCGPSDPSPHPVVGLVLKVEDTEKFLNALGFEPSGTICKLNNITFVLSHSIFSRDIDCQHFQ